MRTQARATTERLDSAALVRSVEGFVWEGRSTKRLETKVVLASGASVSVATCVNEFWTSKQRAASSLHEVSYRACFKPALPRFFIDRLTDAGDTVYDPFMGRGTTPIEASLAGRRAKGSDINPLSRILVGPRLSPVSAEDVEARLKTIDLSRRIKGPKELLVFFHPETLRQIASLKAYFLERDAAGSLDDTDRWIRMVAVNRLTGHSPGFFSVYTLPPNQAVSARSQAKINRDRKQTPPRRDVAAIIVKKTRSLLQDCDSAVLRALREASRDVQLLTGPAARSPEIQAGSVDLVVTSPPFLDVVDYAGDNWLRCWFCGIDVSSVKITIMNKLEDWQAAMGSVFMELRRVLRAGGHVVFEVGEVRGGKIFLEEAATAAAIGAGFDPVMILINDQEFTKTANCWGVDNRRKGTNTNRMVVLRNPG